MIYSENISFNKKEWYHIEWEDIDFRTFDNAEGIKDCKSIEELENTVLKTFPNSNFKSTFIGKIKKKK